MKIRKSRYEYREILKENSNRRNMRADEHPQVYRQLEEEDFQRQELKDEDFCDTIWLSDNSVRIRHYQ